MKLKKNISIEKLKWEQLFDFFKDELRKKGSKNEKVLKDSRLYS